MEILSRVEFKMEIVYQNHRLLNALLLKDILKYLKVVLKYTFQEK